MRGTTTRREAAVDDQWIIQENIARYRRLLEAELDSAKRSILKQLLADCLVQLQPKRPSASANSGERTPERGVIP